MPKKIERLDVVVAADGTGQERLVGVRGPDGRWMLIDSSVSPDSMTAFAQYLAQISEQSMRLVRFHRDPLTGDRRRRMGPARGHGTARHPEGGAGQSLTFVDSLRIQAARVPGGLTRQGHGRRGRTADPLSALAAAAWAATTCGGMGPPAR
jgi:hypothetical protein